MNRRTKLLLLALGISVVFAAWQWFRPYAWTPDPAARFTVSHCYVQRDHNNLWLKVTLKPRKGQLMDYSQPLRLVTTGGKQHEVAQMEQLGSRESRQASPEGNESGIAPAEGPDRLEEVTFSFWLSEADFAGPMKLELNGSALHIRSGDTLPKVADGGFRVYNSSNW